MLSETNPRISPDECRTPSLINVEVCFEAPEQITLSRFLNLFTFGEFVCESLCENISVSFCKNMFPEVGSKVDVRWANLGA